MRSTFVLWGPEPAAALFLPRGIFRMFSFVSGLGHAINCFNPGSNDGHLLHQWHS
jgi:hypothetical protein